MKIVIIVEDYGDIREWLVVLLRDVFFGIEVVVESIVVGGF